ncbi:hypothetical protein [Hyphococcus sp.]|uniref:hypothetical protein n=1 Tax=Hyphococcus sp. TaxID=2038636 RepID=UPI0035C6F33B
MNKPVKIEQHGGLGVLWFIGWLFSVGFLKMGFWKGLLALFIWPYFFGVHFADHAAHETGTAQLESQSD